MITRANIKIRFFFTILLLSTLAISGCEEEQKPPTEQPSENQSEQQSESKSESDKDEESKESATNQPSQPHSIPTSNPNTPTQAPQPTSAVEASEHGQETEGATKEAAVNGELGEQGGQVTEGNTDNSDSSAPTSTGVNPEKRAEESAAAAGESGDQREREIDFSEEESASASNSSAVAQQRSSQNSNNNNNNNNQYQPPVPAPSDARYPSTRATTNAKTSSERIAAMEAELETGMSSYDDMILREQEYILNRNNQRDSEAAVTAAQEATAARPFDEADINEEEGIPGDRGSQTSPEENSPTNGRASRQGDYQYSGGTPPPADIPSGSDDDVVARQIREAAINEKDPELREKIWQEYRKYKKQQ